MARYNEILVGRYNRFLQKLLSMKGDAAVPQLASEFQPIIPTFSGVENRYLEGWDRFSITLSQTAVAAQTNGLQFRNPSGSNVIAVFEKWAFLSNGVGDTFVLNLLNFTASSDLAATASGFPYDPRGRGASSVIGSSAAGSPAQIGTTIETISLQQGVQLYDIFTCDQEVTLLPACTLRLTNIVVNSTTRWLAVWRERALEESERA